MVETFQACHQVGGNTPLLPCTMPHHHHNLCLSISSENSGNSLSSSLADDDENETVSSESARLVINTHNKLFKHNCCAFNALPWNMKCTCPAVREHLIPVHCYLQAWPLVNFSYQVTNSSFSESCPKNKTCHISHSLFLCIDSVAMISQDEERSQSDTSALWLLVFMCNSLGSLQFKPRLGGVSYQPP